MGKLDRLAFGALLGCAGLILGWLLYLLSAWFTVLTIASGLIGIYLLVEGDAASMRGERRGG